MLTKIGIRGLTAVERLYKIKPLHNLWGLIKPPGIRKTHILLPTGMGRPEHSAVSVNQIDQKCQGHPPHLQNPHLHTLRHNHEDVSRVSGIIFNPFKHHKICMLLSLYMLFPVTVAVIIIVIRNDHTLKTMFFQNCNILVHPDLAVDRAFLDVAVHINLHTQTSFILVYPFRHIYYTPICLMVTTNSSAI